MLARHAEALFWAGRQIERAEDTARMLDVTYHALLESPPWEAERSWRDLLKVLWLDQPFAELEQGVRSRTVSEFLVVDPDNSGSIVSSVVQARENARAARELISTELWEAINSFHLDLRSRDLRADIETRPHELYRFVKQSCQLIAGAASETMPRDEGWRFLMLGWELERAEMTCRLLDVRYSQLVAAGASGGFHHWLRTLQSASGSEAFRRRYRASSNPGDVVEFLLLSRTFPRSVLFCLLAAEAHLERLEAGSATLVRPQRLLGRTRSDLEFCDTHELMQGDLHVFLDYLLDGVRQVAEAVALQYFRASHEHDLHALGLAPLASEVG